MSISRTVVFAVGPDENLESNRVEVFDVTRELGIVPLADHPGSSRSDYGVLWGDLDGDDWLDLVFIRHAQGVHGPPAIYMNRPMKDGRRVFVDHFEHSGLHQGVPVYPEQDDRHGASCADYDNDGDMDLFIAHGAKRGETLGIKYDELLRNQGQGQFDEVSHAANVLNSQGRASLGVWGDTDLDGDLDLFISNSNLPSVLYRNDENRSFSDVSRESIKAVGSMHPSFTDYDLDGDLDLMVVGRPRLFANDGRGRFSEVTRQAGLFEDEVIGSDAMAWGDMDADGDTDLFISSRRPGAGALYRNAGGKFERVQGFDLDGAKTRGAAWGDLENDGDLDLIVATTEDLKAYMNDGRGNLSAMSLLGDGEKLRVGEWADVALADYDRDGDLDVALTAGDGLHVLENRSAAGTWLSVRFRGRKNNRMGLGTRVRATAGGVRQVAREYLGDTGFYRSVGCGPLHLGLGRAQKVDLEIIWPGGVSQVLKDVSVNRSIVIEEP